MIEGESSGAVIDKMLPVLEKMEAYQ